MFEKLRMAHVFVALACVGVACGGQSTEEGSTADAGKTKAEDAGTPPPTPDAGSEGGCGSEPALECFGCSMRGPYCIDGHWVCPIDEICADANVEPDAALPACECPATLPEMGSACACTTGAGYCPYYDCPASMLHEAQCVNGAWTETYVFDIQCGD